ncbi:MAG: EAL domain-containing protein [Microcoleus vaginatus WJT46-NPBG5]|nr:EAL domain-containing protein [Microcoleus vaginatus WJT46-NPBG5]
MIDAGVTLRATYDIRLVVLSIAIAMIASHAALALARRITASQGFSRHLWLVSSAFAFGISIWSMNFIAMLADQLPISSSHNLPIVLISAVVAIVASAVALGIVGSRQTSWLKFLPASVFMGAGIAGAHYTGMAAVQLDAFAHYNLIWVALSVAIAISASGAALWLQFQPPLESTRWQLIVQKLASSILMGTAIAGTHYTAMAAVSFTPTPYPIVPVSHAMNNSMLAGGVEIAGTLFFILALLALLLDRRLSIEIARNQVLHQSEKRLRALLQNTSAIIATFAADGTIGYISTSLKQILGYQPEDWLGKKAFALVHPDDLGNYERLLAEALLAPLTNIAAEFRLRHTDGSWREFEVIANNLLAEPSVAGIVTTYREITFGKQSEETVTRLAAIIEATSDFVGTANSQGIVFYINRAGRQLVGIGQQEDTSKINVATYHPQGAGQIILEEGIPAAIRDGVWTGESALQSRDGRIIPVSQLIIAHKKPDGSVDFLSTIARDISEHKRIEAALAKRERYLWALVEVERRLLKFNGSPSCYTGLLTPLGLASGASRIYVFENHRSETGGLLMSQRAEWCAEGVQPELDNPELQNLSYNDFFPRWGEFLGRGEIIAGIVSEFPESERIVLEPQGILSILVLPITVNGEFFGIIGFDNCIEARAWEPVEVNLLAAAAAAISLAQERKQTEQELLKTQERLQHLLNTSPAVIYSCKAEGDFSPTFISENVTTQMGFEPNDFLEDFSFWASRLHPEDAPRVMAGMSHLFEAGFHSHEYRFRCKDGQYHWMQDELKLIVDEAGNVVEIVGCWRDISERKQAESALKQAYEALENRVEERTADLRNANLQLQREIAERQRSQEELLRTTAELKAIFEAFPDIYFRLHSDGTIIDCHTPQNADWPEPPAQLIGKRIQDVITPSAAQQCAEALEQVLATKSLVDVEYSRLIENIKTSFEARFVPLLESQILVIARNITERKQAQDEIEKSLSLLRATLESTTDGIFVVNREGKIESYNQKFLEMWQVPTSVITAPEHGVVLNFVLDQLADPQGFLCRVKELYATPEAESYDIFEFKDGRIFERYSQPQRIGENIVGRVWSFRDVTERKRAEEKIRYQALHDLLTGLPNRMLFNDRLAIALASSQRSGGIMAVMFLDLDRFKVINDTLGHAVGDRLLEAVALRLTSCLRSGDTIARWGGDEFTLLLPQVSCVLDTVKIAQRLLDVLKPIFYLDGHQLHITSSIGIAFYPSDGVDAETLLKNADAALYRAKEQGRNAFQLYTPAINSKASELLVLEHSLHHALEREEFLIYYQPLVNTLTGEIAQMEALVRWQHPTQGLISPAAFIPLAEENGLIVPLGEWVLKTACAQNKAWQDAGLPPIGIAINLSARQLQQSDFVETVRQVLLETGLNAQFLELEVTETVAMQNIEATQSILQELYKMGVRLSLDDFGIGYSSLSYLKKFPFHTIKIDQSFVRDLIANCDDVAIVTAIIALGYGLNLRVVAEGVETEQLKDLLRNLQCQYMQGYFFSRPLPAEEATRLLQKSKESESLPSWRAEVSNSIYNPLGAVNGSYQNLIKFGNSL